MVQGDHWVDGLVFRPERFLDEAGAVRRDEHLIPFSVGKRQCLGETLAKAELFLFFTGPSSSFSNGPKIFLWISKGLCS
jgi:cytochrome P450